MADGPAKLRVKRVGSVQAPLPAYKSQAAAGLDLSAAITEPVVILPGERRLIPTGFAVAIPPGHEGQVRPRSGLALRHGIGIVNSPGTVDADYRGEICVVLINHGAEPFVVDPLARIAQLVISPISRVTVEPVDALDATARGSGGYGSTG
ncbi:MAG TPA: dUTP diphosphatase [Polyangiaceae bacterium]